MGYGLPAAIGASFARPGKRTILVTGDGSLQMSIYELATIARHRLPVKILMFNNQGHGMVRQTQDQWLGGHYYATSVEGGLAAPDFVAVARAHGISESEDAEAERRY
jgi:acetolactate synthase-1/2/3 large subunit